jgi:hypothetical protein
MIMNYLILRDIIPVGRTCKTLYSEVFEPDETQMLTKCCTVDIPADVVPHFKYLLEETPEYLIGINVIHQIKQKNVFGYSLNGAGRMLNWQNYDVIDAAGIISTNHGEGNVVTWGHQSYGGNSHDVQDQLKKHKNDFFQ